MMVPLCVLRMWVELIVGVCVCAGQTETEVLTEDIRQLIQHSVLPQPPPCSSTLLSTLHYYCLSDILSSHHEGTQTQNNLLSYLILIHL